MSSNDWPPETRPEDYFRNRQKEAMHEARRPSPTNPAALLGPGMSARAVEILDWNDEVATFNGFFHSNPGAFNAPEFPSDPSDPASDPLIVPWTGQTIARADGSGMQQVWATDDPVQMHYRVRNFHRNLADPEAPPVFEDWRKYATPSGAIPYEDIEGAPGGSDGTPPVTAPTLVYLGNVGSLFFRWNEVPNDDPVTYRLHVRATLTTNPDGTPTGNPVLNPTVDGTYEVASGIGLTFASVKALHDGTTVLNDGNTTYAAIVSVEDVDTPNPASRLGSAPINAVPTPIGPDEMLVRAELLLADEAFITALNATDFTAVTMTGPVIQTDQRPDHGIHIDAAGLRAYGPNGGAPFLNVDPIAGLVIVAGSGTFASLTVAPPKDPTTGAYLSNGAELGGKTTIPSGSSVVLQSGAVAPGTAPAVGYALPVVEAPAPPNGTWADRKSVSRDHTGTGIVTYNNVKHLVERYSMSTGVPVYLDSSPVIGGTAQTWGTVVYAPSINKYFVLTQITRTPTNSRAWLLYRFDTSWTQEASSDLTGGGGAGAPPLTKNPCVGWNDIDGQVVIAQPNTSGVVQLFRFTFSTGSSATSLSTINTGITYDASLSTCMVMRGDGANVPFDFAAGSGTRYFFSNVTTGSVMCYNSGQDLASTFDAPASSKVGVYWDASLGQFRALHGASGAVYTYTGYHKTTLQTDTATLTKWFTQTYYRSAGGYETPQSVGVKILTKKRHRINITGADISPTPGANDPTGVRFYSAQGTADPTGTRTNMGLMVGQPATGAKTYFWDTYNTVTSSNPPASPGTFPNSAPSGLETAVLASDGQPVAYMRSNGNLRLGPYLMMFGSGQGSVASGGSPGNKVTAGWSAADGVGISWDAANQQATIGVTGRYRITAWVSFAGNGTGQRGVTLWRNAAQYGGQVVGAGGTANSLTARYVETARLNAGDVLYISGSQNSGAALTMNASGLQLAYEGE